MLIHENSARQIADFLLEIQAVLLRPSPPFKWASGWNSPIYCDNRIILSNPKLRNFVKNNFAEAIKEKFSSANAIAGVATAGIAHAALAADVLNLPMAYVRAKPKEHGTGKLIEGRLLKGQKVVVIEDLLSTGKSSLQAVEALREEGIEVLGLLAIFTYGFKEAEEAFAEAGVKYFTLSDFSTLAQQAAKKGFIEPEQEKILAEWRKDPANWKG